MQLNAKNLLLGMLAGALVGAGILLLTTPANSERIRSRFKSLETEAAEKTDNVLSKGKEYVHMKKAQIEEAVKVGKEAAVEKRAELEAEVRAEV